MARISVITTDKEDKAQEGIIVFPQNRTLYVDQFADEIPADDEEREVFKPRNMKEVFEHYRPTKHDIKLETEEGKVVYEDFSFYSLKDFEDISLINQSELLFIEQNKIDAYNAAIKQLESNIILLSAITGETTRNDLKNALQSLLAEIGGDEEKQGIENPAELLEQSINGSLSPFGGFKLITGFINGVENMNPRRKAVRSIFLSDPSYTRARLQLKYELKLWVSILKNGDIDPIEISESWEINLKKLEKFFLANLIAIRKEIKQLEIIYRTLDTFFANAGQDKVEFLTLMNVNKSKLGSFDSEDSKAIRGELQKNYQRLSLVHCYSLLVMPGYLGDAETVRMWARTAYENKVIMVTDFKDCTDFEALHKELEETKILGQDGELSHVVMTCNYLLGRKRSKLVKEEEDLYIPGSGALAGRLTDTESIPISQGVAGMKYGTLSNVKDVRFDLSKMQMLTLIDQCVIPMVKMDGRVMPFSNRSLYDGIIYELKEYPIVRVLDWIEKVIQNFFNEQAFRNWNPAVRDDLKQSICDFLSDYSELIGDYRLKKLELNSTSKEILLVIELRPLFCMRLLMEMVGHIDDSGEINWQ